MDGTKLSSIHGIDDISYHGEYTGTKVKNRETFRQRMSSDGKLVPSIEDAIKAVGLKDGMTISFHHHFRNGDYIVNMVMDAIAKMGIKNLVVAASSLQAIHAPLVEHIRNGVVKRIETSGLRGKLATEISHGLMDTPVVFRSHGGRAAAIAAGELHIDVAFLGAPSSDDYGNANGFSRVEGHTTNCGSLGYAMVDAQYADKVVILTECLVDYPNTPCAIPEDNVDYVVKVDSVGDPKGIMSGATRYSKDPKELLIAKMTAEVCEASGYLYDGFSMQMGSGGASLAACRYIREKMIAQNIKCGYALGGITGQITQMHEEGLIKKVLDVQSFDLIAAESLKNDFYHQQISGEDYASYANKGSATHQLDFCILSALEIDNNFNVNVVTGSDGIVMGAIGGHPDAAAGASLTIIVGPLYRGRIPTVVEKVTTVTTPGSVVDVFVSEQGIAVNPSRPEIKERLIEAGLPVYDIEELQKRAYRIVGNPESIRFKDKVIGLIMYRDNTIIDVVREIDEYKLD